MPDISKRSGFLSLLFIVKDKQMQQMVEEIYHVQDMNTHNIGDISFCLSAEEGLNEVEFNFPDIVFIQTRLKEGEKAGYDVLDIIHKSNPDTYVVMIGEDSSVRNIKKAVSLGAKGFIVLPFSPNSINEYIIRFFRDHFSEDAHGYNDQGET